MARERKITRTITSYRATVMCLNTESAEVTLDSFVTTQKFKENIDLLKYLRKRYETDEYKLVKIDKLECFENTYEMSEEQFMSIAQIVE